MMVGTASRDGARAATAPDERTISVFVVDDHPLVCEGLVAILERESDFRVVGQASSAEGALERLAESDPDVVVLDYHLPGMDGLELCREIAERRLRTNIVVLSAFLQEDVVNAALMAGARAYVVKDVEADYLRRAIRAAARGETLVDPKIGDRASAWPGRLEPAIDPLPPSQMRVLRLVCQGKSNEEIAAAAQLSPHSVKTYLRRIYERLGVNTRAEAVAVAMRRGLV